MRFRVAHLLLATLFVAIWLPTARALLAWEAIDHPAKPQTVLDYLGFYLGTITLVAIPFGLVALWLKGRHGPRE